MGGVGDEAVAVWLQPRRPLLREGRVDGGGAERGVEAEESWAEVSEGVEDDRGDEGSVFEGGERDEDLGGGSLAGQMELVSCISSRGSRRRRWWRRRGGGVDV